VLIAMTGVSGRRLKAFKEIEKIAIARSLVSLFSVFVLWLYAVKVHISFTARLL
jgi:hypothetical protein